MLSLQAMGAHSTASIFVHSRVRLTLAGQFEAWQRTRSALADMVIELNQTHVTLLNTK